MFVVTLRSHLASLAAPVRLGTMAGCALLTLTALFPSAAQQPAQPEAAQQPVSSPAQSVEDRKSTAPQTQPAAGTAKVEEAPQSQSIGEDELKKMLVGKTLYLRGCYLDNTLKFDEYGRLIGRSPQGSYTLNAIEIDKVRLTKHKVELEGIRYGLHFVVSLPPKTRSQPSTRSGSLPRRRRWLSPLTGKWW